MKLGMDASRNLRSAHPRAVFRWEMKSASTIGMTRAGESRFESKNFRAGSNRRSDSSESSASPAAEAAAGGSPAAEARTTTASGGGGHHGACARSHIVQAVDEHERI